MIGIKKGCCSACLKPGHTQLKRVFVKCLLLYVAKTLCSHVPRCKETSKPVSKKPESNVQHEIKSNILASFETCSE